MSIFTGSAVALITPFDERGAVDYKAFDRLIDFHLENGTDAFVICGTTGEASTLSEAEHAVVIHHAIKYIDGRAPVIAGTGSNATYTAVDLSKRAANDGADALLLVTPYYNKATQDGLKDYYMQVSEAVDIPVIMYNVPGRTGCNILPETAVWLARNTPNVKAIKEASGNISQIAKLMALANGELELYSGNDDQILPLLSFGGKGVISVLANVAPRQTSEMVHAYLSGDVERSRELQLEAIELCDALFCEVNPIPVKKACEMMGLCDGYLRSPMTPISAKNEPVLRKALENYGLL